MDDAGYGSDGPEIEVVGRFGGEFVFAGEEWVEHEEVEVWGILGYHGYEGWDVAEDVVVGWGWEGEGAEFAAVVEEAGEEVG